MKTIKNSLVVIAMLGTITGYANLKPLNGLSEGIIKTIINFDNVKKGQRLLIKSTNGTILYKELIQKNGHYKKAFDLTTLPDGDYFFELDTGYEIKIMPFMVTNSNVTFKKHEDNSIFKPVVRTIDNKLFLGKLALGLEPLEVKIYYDNGHYELIHSEEIKGSQNIERIYSLSKNIEGNYKIVCKTQGRVFVNYFKV